MELPLLEEKDLPAIRKIQPTDWNDIIPVFRAHLGQDYFYAIKVMEGDRLAGIGELISNQHSAWLGNIVVGDAFQGRGIGSQITGQLMQKGLNQAQNLFLLATPAGEKIYRKLGFRENGKYLFFKKLDPTRTNDFEPDHSIEPYHPKYADQILQMDQKAMGENRRQVLMRFLDNARVFVKRPGIIGGFYLPDLGEGLIIAENATAGLALFQLRVQNGLKAVVVPEQNRWMIDHLELQGYEFFREAFQMYFGKEKNWRPEMVYGRVGGYLG